MRRERGSEIVPSFATEGRGAQETRGRKWLTEKKSWTETQQLRKSWGVRYERREKKNRRLRYEGRNKYSVYGK